MKKTLIIFNLLLLVNTLLFSQTEKRLALVIGNSAYPGGHALKNPVNDANLMASTLQSLGFTVIKRTNANKQQMDAAVMDFSRKLASHNIALFYYAGHGIQVDGVNYLIPIDAGLNDKIAIQFEAVDVSKVVTQFEYYPNNINVVILDACRDNPFRSWARGGNRGFKAIPAPSGTIIAFATAEGATASDGTGSNGLYTEKLVQQMKTPQRIEDVFIQTRVLVQRASGGAQSPQEWSQLTGKFYFKKPAGGQAVTNVSNVPVSKSGDVSISEERLAPGTIKLATYLSGNLYLDGIDKGTLGSSRVYTLDNISPGQHHLKIGTWQQSVFVESNSIAEITARVDNTSLKSSSLSGYGNDLPDRFTDSRDGKTYKMVEIGSQVWMAENLNYDAGSGCWCYDDNSSNCSKYGRLYTWEKAKNVCPSGWRLPTKAEFEILLNKVGGTGNAAYTALIDGGSSGFSAPFGGYRDRNGYFYYEGYYASFWSSSEGSSYDGWNLGISSDYKKANMYSYAKSYGFSVRCVQDH